MKNITVICFFNLIFFTGFSQSEQLTLEEYQVINDLYSEYKGRTAEDKIRDYFYKQPREIYYKTNSFKGWSYFLSAPKLNTLWGTPPTNYEINKVIKWEEFLTEEDFKNLKKQIRNSNSKILDTTYLLKTLELTKSWNYSGITISKPFIFENKAIIFRTRSDGSEAIIFLEKQFDKWKMVYQKWIYYPPHIDYISSYYADINKKVKDSISKIKQ